MVSWTTVLSAVAALSVMVRATESSTTETYTIFHRVIDALDSKDATPWYPRALIHVPKSLAQADDVQYEGITSNLEFPADPKNKLYQIKAVPRTKTAEDEEASFMSYTKLCQLRIPNDGEALPDAIKVYLSHLPTASSPAPWVTNLAYVVEQDVPMDKDACPILAKDASYYPTSFATELRLLVPEVAPSPVITEDTVTSNTQDAPKDGKKKPEKPKNLVEFLRQYWMYFLPLIVLFMMPASEDIPDRPAGAPAGSAGVAKRVTPGPAAAGSAAKKN
ncbi:hypothetical protein ACI68E_002313 [Malassezia pachydermatis]|uniref:ER membrane protein complex subunit 10 n=1 Tax=Malassezia pachydermatis TaxID=77020 RepID=A0A0M8MMJ5_9BASI|nr:hypothetical protein Malapachy_0895 [Malassezia pachydermatis]KOS14578.1 hypothetical protein Malapachy_0895 [Malassezia pachydermatis]